MMREKDEKTGKPKGGVNLHFDQRVFLRATMRFFNMYGVFPRAWGKTFCEIAACFCACILYPGVEISLTAQTKEAAAKLLKDKYMLSCLESADIYNWSNYESTNDADPFPTDKEIVMKAKQMLKNYENF